MRTQGTSKRTRQREAKRQTTRDQIKTRMLSASIREREALLISEEFAALPSGERDYLTGFADGLNSAPLIPHFTNLRACEALAAHAAKEQTYGN